MSNDTERRIADTLEMVDKMLCGLLVAVVIIGVVMLATFNLMGHRIASALEASQRAVTKAQPGK